MAAACILSILAAVFLVASVWRIAADGYRIGIAARTWLGIALIFATVSAFLGWTGGA